MSAVAFLNTRRRRIRTRGNTYTLRRPLTVNTFATVDLLGEFRAYMPEQLLAGVEQGDARLSILTDEIDYARWPTPPVKQDSVIIDGKPWYVRGVLRVQVSNVTIGFDLWIRGGG